jgi:ElaB/YqjD/DUF883 family membrane-anchored ribosome-binding protein
MPKNMPLATQVHDAAEHASKKFDLAADKAQQRAHEAVDSLHDSVTGVSNATPAALTRAASRVEDMADRAVARARQTSTQVRAQAHRAGDATVGYIKEEPVKSVLIAAAAGATAATLLSWMRNSRE